MHKQDPMSHRIIEKRRRDRMNNCLADLSRLIPTTYLKKGRGRIEKTEIIEMAIKHLKHLQAHPCTDPVNCDVAKSAEQERQRQFRLGFQESMSESIRFLVEIEGFYAENGACIRLINHLQKHYDKLINGHCRMGTNVEIESHEGLLVEVMDTESVASRTTPDRLLSFSSHQNPKDEYQEATKIEDVSRERGDMSQLSCPRSNTPMHHSSETSQLRQMLQNPGVPIDRLRSNSYSTGTVNHGNSTADRRPSSVSLCSPFNHSNSIHRADEVYKFKNNIKERFNADSGHTGDSSTPNFRAQNGHIRNANSYSAANGESVASLTQSLLVNTDVPSSSSPSYSCDFLGKPVDNSPVAEKGCISNGWDMMESSSAFCSNRNSSDHGQSSGSSSGYSTGTETFSNRKYPSQSPEAYSDSPENLSTSSGSPTSQACNPLIPIFALHPKGTYYIPLSLDAALVTPYVSNFDETVPSLHPISISVNFNCPTRTMNRISVDSWEQPSFYVRDRYAKRCGSPDKSSVSVPYTLVARN